MEDSNERGGQFVWAGRIVRVLGEGGAGAKAGFKQGHPKKLQRAPEHPPKGDGVGLRMQKVEKGGREVYAQHEHGTSRGKYPCPGPVPEDMKARQAEKTRTGHVLGGFAIGLGVAGLYFALQLWILPAAGIPT